MNPTNGDTWIIGDPVPAGAPNGFVPGDGVVWVDTAWINVGPIRGPSGAQGASGLQGESGPQGPTGAQGDAGAT
ncbi:collagen-like repeat preface domain-containing protein, partial [bacterium]|nr:collagen-like repeat preface domain-containing protein [bacterium]